MAFYASAQRAHKSYKALLATAQRRQTFILYIRLANFYGNFQTLSMLGEPIFCGRTIRRYRGKPAS